MIAILAVLAAAYGAFAGAFAMRVWRRQPKVTVSAAAPPLVVSVEALSVMADVLTGAMTKTVDEVARAIGEQLRGSIGETHQVREPAPDERWAPPPLDDTDPTDASIPSPWRGPDAVLYQPGDLDFLSTDPPPLTGF